MFASFGPISFQPLASPTKLEIEKKYHYEALNVIGAPPVLQWIYDNLRHVELSIYLHNFWCKPQKAIDALTQLADFHVPQQFVFGNKNILGTFVISNYRLKQRWMADDGSVIAAEMDLELTEYVAPSTLQSNTMTVGTIGNSTINTNPPGLTTSQSAAKGSTLVKSPASAAPNKLLQTLKKFNSVATQLLSAGKSVSASWTSALSTGIDYLSKETSSWTGETVTTAAMNSAALAVTSTISGISSSPSYASILSQANANSTSLLASFGITQYTSIAASIIARAA